MLTKLGLACSDDGSLDSKYKNIPVHSSIPSFVRYTRFLSPFKLLVSSRRLLPSQDVTHRIII